MFGLRANVDAIKRTFLTSPPRRGEGETGVKITGAHPSGRGLGARTCCMSSVFLGGSTICRLHKSNLSDQARSSTHCATESHYCRFSVKNLSLSAPARSTKNFFRWGLNLLSATLASNPGRNRIWNLQHTASTTTH